MWLAYWYAQQTSFEFEWDSANVSKSKQKHGVDTEEVESVFDLKLAAPLGRQVAPETSEERLCKERNLYEEVRKATERV